MRQIMMIVFIAYALIDFGFGCAFFYFKDLAKGGDCMEDATRDLVLGLLIGGVV